MSILNLTRADSRKIGDNIAYPQQKIPPLAGFSI